MGQSHLPRLRVLDVADRIPGLPHGLRHPVVAFRARAGRPLHEQRRAGLELPFRADLGEVVREVERRARSIRAMDDRDARIRQLDGRVERFDRGIRPLRDLAEKDVCEQRPRKLDLTGSTPSRLTTTTTPPITIGNWPRPRLIRSFDLRGMSDAPKSTARSLTRSVPASEPTGSSSAWTWPADPRARRWASESHRLALAPRDTPVTISPAPGRRRSIRPP